MKQQLSVVIPAFNELENFKQDKLSEISDYLQKKHINWQVIVVDDGSTDGSNQKIKQFVKNHQHWQFIQNPHFGKASAVKTGIFAAKHPFTLFTDFDQATPISEVEKLLPFINKGYQIVIGSREVKGALRQSEPWFRHLMGKVFNFLVQLIAIRGIHDTQCGFKLFNTNLAQNLFQSLVVYHDKNEKHAFTGAFDVELLFIANKKNIPIAEVPVHWAYEPTNRVSPIRDSIRMFIDILKIRLADLFKAYR